MSSSGFASSTRKSADFPTASVPSSSSRRISAEFAGRRDDRLRGRQPGVHHQLQLDQRRETEVLTAGHAAGVGAESQHHARGIQRRDVSQQPPGALALRPVRATLCSKTTRRGA